MSDHSSCSQGPRFDSLEHTLEGIHESLKALTELIVSQTRTDTQMVAVQEKLKDHEDRLRVIEKHIAKNLWLERAAWIILAAVLTAYFNLN